jgi:hypothetical protein
VGTLVRLAALALAALAAMATSGGEANDEEDTAGGNDPGGETLVSDDSVDFTEVTEPTTVVVGGSDFVLTGDGRHVITLRTEWHGGGGEPTELRSRRLLAIDTQGGQVVGSLDLVEAGSFGLVLLSDGERLVLVRRDAEDRIIGLDTVRLPGLAVEETYVPQTRGNRVRLSPSGRYAAIWSVNRIGWPAWDFFLTVPDLVVGIEDRQTGGAPLQLTSAHGVADVIAAPDESAFYVALSTRGGYDVEPTAYFLEIVRVTLGPNLPTTTLLLPQAGHASSTEIKGGSALRLSPDGATLTFSGCSFVTGTCVARWYVIDVADLSLAGDLRAAGASAFTPDGGRAIGWDGSSSEEGKIWVADCVLSDGGGVTDHWLLDVDLETLEATPIDLPKLAPYYFVTRDGAYAVASVENCEVEELWVADLQTGAIGEVRYADHGLHHFTVLEDHRTLFSVDKGVLERIDLDAKESTPTAYAGWAARINRLPGGALLVLADPDLLVFTLWDAETEERRWRLDLTTGVTSPPAPLGRPAEPFLPLPRAASQVEGLWHRGGALGRPSRARLAPRELRPRLAGGAPGVELRF